MSERLAYSVREAAEVMGLSEWLIKEEVAQGRIRCVRFGRRVVIPRWALDERLGMVEEEETIRESPLQR